MTERSGSRGGDRGWGSALCACDFARTPTDDCSGEGDDSMVLVEQLLKKSGQAGLNPMGDIFPVSVICRG